MPLPHQRGRIRLVLKASDAGLGGQAVPRFPPSLHDASLIVPNFGDYIDSAVSVTGSAPFVGTTVYFVWSDGRLGIRQPFEAHLPAG